MCRFRRFPGKDDSGFTFIELIVGVIVLAVVAIAIRYIAVPLYRSAEDALNVRQHANVEVCSVTPTKIKTSNGTTYNLTASVTPPAVGDVVKITYNRKTHDVLVIGTVKSHKTITTC